MSDQQDVTSADIADARELIIGPDNPENEGEFLVNDLPTTPGKFENADAGGTTTSSPSYGGRTMPLTAPPGQEAGASSADADGSGYSLLIRGTTTDGHRVEVYEAEGDRGANIALTTADFSNAFERFGDRVLAIESTERGVQVRVSGDTDTTEEVAPA